MSVTLIFPHQLFKEHPALKKSRGVVLLEEALFFGGDPYWGIQFHKKKLILHRASMKAYEERLIAEGFKVNYRDWQKGEVSLEGFFSSVSEREVHFCDPVDDVLSRRLERLAKIYGMKLVSYPSPNFLNDRATNEELLGHKKPFMATFYKAQRVRMNFLMESDGKSPVGGKWSFDEENRKKLPKTQPVPEPPSALRTVHVEEAERYVTETFPEAWGQSYGFTYPVTHEQAEAWLQGFFKERFQLFGDYEDAISMSHKVMFHSVITPALNIGLLSPDEVTREAVKYAERHGVPLNSLEGFIRQVIGWREFMRAMYEKYGVQERNSNFWGFTRKMPASFYEGTTGVTPIDDTIHQVLETGYCHHIERLMLLGSFMLLCRIHPTEVYTWFMELFIDSYDWVMVPNVYGMSQFSDGGIFTTKPYISGSNYVRKMSDYKKGDWGEVWDGLFWSFIGDYHEVFAKNARMSRMTWMYDKMDEEKKSQHHMKAEAFLKSLG